MLHTFLVAASVAGSALSPLPVALGEVFVRIPSATMEPTFAADSLAIVEPIVEAPARGEVVVTQSPNQPSLRLALRVIGLPGDRIEFDDGFPVINGRKLKNLVPWIPPAQTGWAKFPVWSKSYVVPPDSYYLLADNHKESAFDSLVFGGVSGNLLRGRLVSWEAAKSSPGRISAAFMRLLTPLRQQLPLQLADGYVLTAVDATDAEVHVTFRIPLANTAILREQGQALVRESLCQNRFFQRALGLSATYSFAFGIDQGLQFQIKQSDCIGQK